MHRRLIACVALACAFLVGSALRPQPAAAAGRNAQLSHIYYIMMENQGFDDVIGHENVSGGPYKVDAPFITNLAFTYGLETLSFGTTHPSLPNYLSLIAGSYFGIQDDNPSCYAVPKQTTCDAQAENATNLVDELEAAGLTWLDMQQSMPSVGYLGPQFPTSSTGPTHYAQKHNPFLYFKDIATNPTRLKKIVPLTPASLAATFSNPATVPNFVFLVPDQCHDMHGTSDCSAEDALITEGDTYVQTLVTTIMKSKAWNSTSAIIVAWDENDYSSSIGCCGSVYPHGGGHNMAIVITDAYKTTGPVEIATPSNHYNELRSIEDAFGLPHLANSATQGPSLNALLYPLQYLTSTRRY
jgi:phospholipase C